MTEIREITEVARHRNGIGGESFYAVSFVDSEGQNMVATVFAPLGPDGINEAEHPWVELRFHNPRIAVLEIDQLPTVTFGQNSWRGDIYATELYAAIDAYEAESWDRINALIQTDQGDSG